MAALAHCQTLFGPFLGWAGALALQGSLPKRDHELLALRAAHRCGSAFEWHEHAAFARAAGVRDDEIERVRTGRGGWAPHEALLLQAADELVERFTLSASTWDDLSAHYDTAQIVEAVFVVGQYTMLSMVANVVEGA
jgi:alkylhydroperoxidase family enzyme